MGGKLLEVDGSSIKFICEIKKQSTSSVHLSNISDEYVAFKVKTTSPKRFCVRPNSGIISPKSECSFTVTMQGLRTHPSEVECKDKFLIQSTVVDSGTKEEDITLELFSKSSGKYVEEKKLRVVLASKEDSPIEEHKNKESHKEPINKEDSHKHKELQKEPSNEEASHKEHKHKELQKDPSHEASHKEHKHKVLEKEPDKEASVKEHKQKVLEKEASNEAASHKEHKHKVLEKEASNEALVKEHKHKVLEKEPSNEASTKEHKQKVLEKKPSNEASIKEDKENLVKSDKDVSSMHTQIEDAKEVKGGLTTEESKQSNDPDGNGGNIPKNLKFNPVKIVKEDPEKRLRLSNQLKELKLKESTLEDQLKEAKSTISNLTYQNSIIIEAKETLQLELDRRSKKGFSFVFVCGVSLIGLIGGYLSDP